MLRSRISVIIPNYQGEKYLEKTVQSLLAQDYPNLELIIIDGGSQDRSLEIIKEYEPYIYHWVREPDKGQSDAINKGFAKSTGEIVTFIGSDDTYIPGTLIDVATQFRENPNVGAIVGAFQLQDETSKIISDPIIPLLNQPSPLDLTLVKPSQYRLHQVSTFYIRTALEKVGFWVREDLRYVMDRELLYRVCQEYPILLVDRVYGIFRKHSLSKSENSILPFAEEFAGLYIQSMSGDRVKDRLRARNARYFRASGLVKYARATDQFQLALVSLLKALLLWPGFLFRYSYLSTWRYALRKWIYPI